jgi:hypothetical protein
VGDNNMKTIQKTQRRSTLKTPGINRRRHRSAFKAPKINRRRRHSAFEASGINRRRFIRVAGGTALAFGTGLVPLSADAISWSGIWSGIKKFFNCSNCTSGFCICFPGTKSGQSGSSGFTTVTPGTGSLFSTSGFSSGSGTELKGSGIPFTPMLCWCHAF